MEITFENLDIGVYEARKVKPASVVERGPRDLWVIREQPLGTELSPPWLSSLNGEHFQVPLHSYRTNGTEPSNAMAFAFQLGVQAGLEMLVSGYRPTRMHLVFGSPVQEENGTLQFWVGVAFRVERG